MGGVDPEMLKNVNMDDISEEQLEQQMRMFYKMMKGGKSPEDIVREAQGTKDDE